MNDIFKKYEKELNNIKREDPLWYLEIEYQLYDKINRADSLNFNFTEILETDDCSISDTIFKDDRVFRLMDILMEVGFNCSYDEYDDNNECTTLTILWSNIHRQNIT